MRNLRHLLKADINELRKFWKNKRSSIIDKELAFYLSTLRNNNREPLITWPKNAKLENLKEEPIRRIRILV